MRARKALGASLALLAVPCALHAQDPAEEARTEDIVVTATRSGIPVWRVTGPKTTIVLVGTIRSVSPETRWNAAA